MISKAQVKHIRSLEDKKKRYEYRQFVIEGKKMTAELLKSRFQIVELFATQNWISAHTGALSQDLKITVVNEQELARISSLVTPEEVLALVMIPDTKLPLHFKSALLLDGIQDPGNLGSIIRIADWYGIPYVICNEKTVDVYNSKVLKATMGSIFRVQCHYTDLNIFLEKHQHMDRYACVLNGQDVNECERMNDGLILIGSEANGLSEALISLSNFKITIPKKGHAESLNAAVAAGIVCNALLK